MKRPPSNERELLERAGQHDEPAFAALVELYTPALFRIVRRMVSDTMEAEAIVQETFWRFWRALPRYSADRPLLPYLATIASNLARDRFRRDRRIADVAVEDVLEARAAKSDVDLDRMIDDESTLRRLADEVQALPLAYRSVIALRYEAGMSYEQIADALSLPLNTVRTHLRRAKEILRRSVQEPDNG
jgi:RNA polymerase sigma-70 factor (ECF subfamily)